MNAFAGKVALVTGASSGIGESFARLLAKSGANLILVARREDRLKAIADELSHTFAVEVHTIAHDLGVAGAAEALFQKTEDMGIKVDLLINNAGLGKHGDFLESSLESQHQMIDLNIVALTDMTHFYGNDMAKRGKGQILLVASIASFMPIPKFATYAATKAFVLTLGESLAKELAPKGVTVTTLCPGGTLTEFMDVAGQKIEGIRSLAMMTSDEVALSGLKALRCRKHVIVPGFLYKFSIASLRLIPRRLQATLGQMATE